MPKKSLTDLAVQSIKLPPKPKKKGDIGQVDYFDKGYPGLALRVSYGGSRVWIYSFRGFSPKAQRVTARRIKLGEYPSMTLAGAREAWRRAHVAVQSGHDPQADASDDTVGSAVETWLKTQQAGLRGKGEVERIFKKNVLPFWAMRKLAEIKPKDCLNVIDIVANRGSPIMANRVHAHLHSFFGWAVSRLMIPANPMAGLKRPARETKRDRVLDDAELLAVWRACDEVGWPFGVAIQMLILTGCRREEIGALKRSEIGDLEIKDKDKKIVWRGNAIQLAGDRTKNGDPHIIPLSNAATELLDALPRIVGSDFVFPSSRARDRHIEAWDAAKDQLGDMLTIKPWRLHDLRRTAATGLQRLGTPLQVTEAVLNHAGSRAGIAGVYQLHDYSREKAEALEAWGQHVMGLVGAKRQTRKTGRLAS
jgi:integrase